MGPPTSSLAVMWSFKRNTSNTGDSLMPARTERSNREIGNVLTRVTPALSTIVMATERTPRAGSVSASSRARAARAICSAGVILLDYSLPPATAGTPCGGASRCLVSEMK